MYYTFTHALTTYVGGLNQAELVSTFPQSTPHWWDPKPITSPIPELTFQVFHAAPLLDSYFTGTTFELYSDRLLSILIDFDIQFETFPAVITSKKTQEVRSSSYRVFHLLERYPGLDRKKTLVNRPVISAQRMNEPKYLFRDDNDFHLVLIHHNLKVALEQQHISGCQFGPVLNNEDAPALFNW